MKLPKQSDIAMNVSEQIWQDFTKALLKDEIKGFETFTDFQWRSLKKALYPMTHENVRDFIPQNVSCCISYKYGYKHGFFDSSNSESFDDTLQQERTFTDNLLNMKTGQPCEISKSCISQLK